MFRRAGSVSLAVLSFFLLCGDTAPASCKEQQIGPSTGEVVGAGVAIIGAITIGTVVLVHVHNSHHNIKGCVVTGPNGIEMHTGSGADAKVYNVAGDPNIKVGDLVKVHGSKVKKTKDSRGDETFAVEKLTRDYGPCKA